MIRVQGPQRRQRRRATLRVTRDALRASVLLLTLLGSLVAGSQEAEAAGVTI